MSTPISSGEVGSILEASGLEIQVVADDIVQGCVEYLSVQSVLTPLVGSDDDGSYIFQYQLGTVLESTESSALVVSRLGGWSPPNEYNTQKFPRISIELYVDPIRDDDHNVTEPAEASRRAFYILDVVDSVLHRPQGGVQMWGDLRTTQCVRLGEPIAYAVPNGDGMVRGQAFYGVAQG